MPRLPHLPEQEEMTPLIKALGQPLNKPQDLDPLLHRIGEARFVLLGEASHGTSEFYTWRTEITKRLILEKGFSFLAVEGDWPDCYQVNRYIKGLPEAVANAREALQVFRRWPTWMWANEEIVDLVDWLHEHNAQSPPEKKVGFYGLDVYSLWDSLYAVMGYLQKSAPENLSAARKAFRCFEPYGEDAQDYARSTTLVPTSCEEEVVSLLGALRRKAPDYRQDGKEAFFAAEQNALVVKNAEAYYRAMVRGGPQSWNVRDQHMMETLDRLIQHHGPGTRAIVWAHNTHIGDARHTDMAGDGMINLGQLVREKHDMEGVILVGFGTHRGRVIAGREWDAPMKSMPVPVAQAGSWEEVLHQVSPRNQLLVFEPFATPASTKANSATVNPLLVPRGHRAIGVVYHPQNEHFGNYVPTVLPRRYDAFLYLDETEALQPLPVEVQDNGEVPETYPAGV
jgi:erythromycin esterase